MDYQKAEQVLQMNGGGEYILKKCLLLICVCVVFLAGCSTNVKNMTKAEKAEPESFVKQEFSDAVIWNGFAKTYHDYLYYALTTNAQLLEGVIR